MIGKKTRLFSAVLLLFVALFALSGAVSALNAEIDWVKLDGDLLSPGLNQVQDIERDNDFEVRVSVEAFEDLDNVEIEAMLAGYDHNDRATATTEVFDMKANVSYTKKLELKFPARMDEDQYRLRIYVRDRSSDELQQEFYLYVDTVRHSIQIKDINLDPSDEVEAGRSVRVLVNLKNYGQLDEDDVKVEFAIPELGIKALPDYLDIESGESETTEELYLRIPVCTEAGQYQGQVKVSYDDGDEVEVEDVLLNIVDSPTGCGLDDDEDSSDDDDSEPQQPQQPQPPVAQQKTVITVGAQSQEVVAGEGGAIYPLTFTNSGSDTKTYVVSVTGADDWATVKISPLQTVTIGPGESKSVYVYVSAKETAAPGEHMFSIEVKDAAGNPVKQIPLSASVVAGEGSDAAAEKSGLRKALEIGLIVLVVILVIIALIVLFTRKKDDEEEEAEDEISGQTYY
ncbi:TPA: hypothetical protein HA265_00135 [Candidatus Woesearchaeota archaeon]|nr:hypothetical protein [Candidatus Woesearchaeota archaeon]